MRAILPLAALLLITGAVSAQNADTAQSRLANQLQLMNRPVSCPIRLAAKRSPGLTVRTIQNGSSAPATQGLRLTFLSRLRPEIAQVDITVHGTSFKAGVMPLNGADSDLTEQFTLTPKPGETLQQALIEMHTVKNARWIQINEIHFTDGSTWHPTQLSNCTASISRYLPIDSSVSTAY